MSNTNTDGNDGSGSIDINSESELRSAYWGDELSITKIAEQADVSTSTVHSRMKKFDIPRRSRSESMNGVHRVEYCSFRTDENGYERWQLSDVDDGEHFRVHRLVAIAEYGPEAVANNAVHHKNGVKWDNRPENLEIMKPGEHSSHHNTGSGHGTTELTTEDVRQIKRELKRGDKQADIADRYDTNPATVSRINTGKSWDHVTLE